LHNIYQSVNKTFRKKKKNSFISLKKYIKWKITIFFII
jgi:hypothetical protein